MAEIASKIMPCLWFASDAEAAAAFYVDAIPGSRIEHVQRNVSDGPSGPAGSVLVIEMDLAGQRFLLLNGGEPAEYTHAISFHIPCADQAEVDRLWDGLLAGGGEPVQCGWLRDRCGVSWQIVPAVLMRLIADPDPTKAARVMAALHAMVKIDVAALEAAHRGD